MEGDGNNGYNNGGMFGNISIHALRVEGDQEFFTAYEKAHAISIHALRVEGDLRFRRQGL